MVIDFKKNTDTNADYDICIVGAGIVGLALVNELKDSGKKICLIESADGENDAIISEAKTVQTEKLTIKPNSRERALGGTSTTWWGLSGLLDRLDYQPQDHIPFSGWPITYEEIEPYIKTASEKYGFPDYSVYSDPANLNTPLLEGSPALQPEVLAATVKPTRFWKEYQSIFEQENVNLIKGLTVTKLESNENGHIICAIGKNLEGEEIKIESDKFVLAAGGIENPRILLNSTTPAGHSLGNEFDQVGRYFMNHPKGYCGKIVVHDPKVFEKHFLRTGNGLRVFTGISLSQEKRLQEKLLHSYLQIDPIYPWNDDQNFDNVMRVLKQPNKLETISQLGLVTAIKSFVLAMPKLCVYYFYKATRLTPRTKVGRIRNYLDMAPRPDRKIVLTSEMDQFGVPIPKLVGDITDLEKQSLIVLHKVLNQVLRDKKIGHLESDLATCESWPITDDASHHMGTTRMGEDPKSSVVDAHLRLHDCENVFVTGTSVFSTGGCVNPTLIATALSVRLREYLVSI